MTGKKQSSKINLLNSTEFGPFNKRRDIKSGKQENKGNTISVGGRSNNIRINRGGGDSSLKVGQNNMFEDGADIIETEECQERDDSGDEI